MKPEVKERSDRFNKVWESRRMGALEKPVEVIVMGRRCVYINERRIAGGKPYVSENLPHHTLNTTLGRILDAFKDDEIMQAIQDRQYNRELIEKWQRENPSPAPPQD